MHHAELRRPADVSESGRRFRREASLSVQNLKKGGDGGRRGYRGSVFPSYYFARPLLCALSCQCVQADLLS